jgi:hypothetical protein
MVEAVKTLLSTANITLIQRTSNPIGVDFLSSFAIRRSLIDEFLSQLSDAYRNEDIVELDEEFILSEILEYSSVTKNYIELLGWMWVAG